MPMLDFHFAYQVHDTHQSLNIKDQSLIDQALHACSKAYAPYSKFYVGAAIRTADGRTIIGSNQENEAFPIGQCAERVALYGLVHAYGRQPIDTIAIAVDHQDQVSVVSPCGSCRQMLHEYRRHQPAPIRLLLTLAGGGPVMEIQDIKDLLPFAFDGSFLGQ